MVNTLYNKYPRCNLIILFTINYNFLRFKRLFPFQMYNSLSSIHRKCHSVACDYPLQETYFKCNIRLFLLFYSIRKS